MRRNPFTAPLATLALSHLLGCSAGSTEPPGTVAGPPDDRGVPVIGFGRINNLIWSTDGSELYFVEGSVRILAVTVTAAANPRTLYSSKSSLGHLSAAGNRLYVSTGTSNPPAQYRILRIDPVTSNVDTVLTYHGQTRSERFAISADERFVAYGDSLFDLESKTQMALPRGDPWSFSPDGSLLLYALEPLGGGPTSFIPIATNGAASPSLGPASDVAFGSAYRGEAHHWSGNDPRLLRVAGGKLLKASVFDLRTATNRAIASIWSDNAYSRAAAISADGKRAVVWIGVAGGDQLHAIDTETLTDVVIATVNTDKHNIVQSIVLSPDGSRAAYVVWDGSALSGPGTYNVYVVTP